MCGELLESWANAADELFVAVVVFCEVTLSSGEVLVDELVGL